MPTEPRLLESLEECESDLVSRPLVREMLSRVGDKWTMLVIRALADSPLRFGALLAAVPAISHRMLTVTLRALERDGLVARIAYAELPPRVEYHLTELGETLLPVVLTLITWVQGHRVEVETSRLQFDEQA